MDLLAQMINIQFENGILIRKLQKIPWLLVASCHIFWTTYDQADKREVSYNEYAWKAKIFFFNECPLLGSYWTQKGFFRTPFTESSPKFRV